MSLLWFCTMYSFYMAHPLLTEVVLIVFLYFQCLLNTLFLWEVSPTNHRLLILFKHGATNGKHCTFDFGWYDRGQYVRNVLEPCGGRVKSNYAAHDAFAIQKCIGRGNFMQLAMVARYQQCQTNAPPSNPQAITYSFVVPICSVQLI
jgi:hypothetical protein